MWLVEGLSGGVAHQHGQPVSLPGWGHGGKGTAVTNVHRSSGRRPMWTLTRPLRTCRANDVGVNCCPSTGAPGMDCCPSPDPSDMDCCPSLDPSDMDCCPSPDLSDMDCCPSPDLSDMDCCPSPDLSDMDCCPSPDLSDMDCGPSVTQSPTSLAGKRSLCWRRSISRQDGGVLTEAESCSVSRLRSRHRHLLAVCDCSFHLQVHFRQGLAGHQPREQVFGGQARP